MKVGVIGAGGVGTACMMALIMRGVAREIVLVNRDTKKAQGVIADMQYGASLTREVILRAGDYSDLKGASLILITIGINEHAGGATDRNDPAGRLKLLNINAKVFQEVVPLIVKAAPDALLLVVTDPPDPLAELTRKLAGHDKVLSTGTFLDSCRFRRHLSNHFGVSLSSVHADVIGEHGVSQVFLWSSATVGGIPLSKLSFPKDGQAKIEHEVRFANITIIEGIKASQYGIGMVCGRIAEIIARDEKVLFPIGSYHPRYQTTLSLPTIIGKTGAIQVLEPFMSPQEEEAFHKSAATLKKAFDQISL